jgi:hypothetical protein|tara:strand:+ start:832 stop:1425 length:594 start_codon:yes stop_codon:yes gene_type:complete
MIERKNSIKNFIGVYDNYITDIDCNQAITFFEEQNNFNRAISRQAFESAPVFNKKDNQYFANQGNTDVWVETIKPLVFNFDQALKHYERETGIKEVYGDDDFKYTTMKIQKTVPKGGYHVWHIEHNKGLDNSNRALAWLIYLNDIEEGGETEFLNQSMRVQPKKGRIVMWPAAFPYVHRGNPPLKEEKYILTSWMTI